MIRASDRVATVIASDASLIDVFVALSPAFERLRNTRMRKVMGRLVTVEQAARMAGIDAAELVRRLNAHAENGAEGDRMSIEIHTAARGGSVATAELETQPEMPAALARIPEDRRAELDVRAELRAGQEPFSRIMAALREVPGDGAFAVRAIFEPVPLYAVMRRQGLAHFTEHLADDDWRVWFFRDTADDAAAAAAAAGAAAALASATAASASGASPPDQTGVVVLDVRGLEPPEPMVRTLAALAELPEQGTLVQMNVRVPQFLLPLLEERGFTYEVREQSPDLVRVFIRHRTAGPAAAS